MAGPASTGPGRRAARSIGTPHPPSAPSRVDGAGDPPSATAGRGRLPADPPLRSPSRLREAGPADRRRPGGLLGVVRMPYRPPRLPITVEVCRLDAGGRFASRDLRALVADGDGAHLAAVTGYGHIALRPAGRIDLCDDGRTIRDGSDGGDGAVLEVDGRGRITLPAQLRTQLGVEDDDRLLVLTDPARQVAYLLHAAAAIGGLDGLLPPGALGDDDAAAVDVDAPTVDRLRGVPRMGDR